MASFLDLLTIRSSLLLPVRLLNTSSRRERWYTHFFKLKKPNVPRKNPPHFNFDWEHNRLPRLNPDQFLPEAQSNPQFGELPPYAKELFTNKFLSRGEEFERQLNSKLRELGYHPLELNAATDVIRLTMKLRYKKALLELHPKNSTLRCATECLLLARRRSIRRLRALDMSEFKRICAALDITTFRHADHYTDLQLSEVGLRKKAESNACYQQRLAKLALLKKEVATSSHQFFQRKERDLSNILSELTAVYVDANGSSGTVEEKVKETLKQLMDEVIEERKLEALEVPQQDELAWYSQEADMRELVAKVSAEKEAKQLRRAKK